MDTLLSSQTSPIWLKVLRRLKFEVCPIHLLYVSTSQDHRSPHTSDSDAIYNMTSPEVKTDSPKSRLSFGSRRIDAGCARDSSGGISLQHEANSTTIDPAHQSTQQTSPKHKPFQNTSTNLSTVNAEDRQRYENYFSAEEQEKLRAKGINPALKAEMEIKRKESGGGFMGKFFGSGVGSAPGSFGG